MPDGLHSQWRPERGKVLKKPSFRIAVWDFEDICIRDAAQLYIRHPLYCSSGARRHNKLVYINVNTAPQSRLLESLTFDLAYSRFSTVYRVQRSFWIGSLTVGAPDIRPEAQRPQLHYERCEARGVMRLEAAGTQKLHANTCHRSSLE